MSNLCQNCDDYGTDDCLSCAKSKNAEIETLKREVDRLRNDRDAAISDMWGMCEEIERLRADALKQSRNARGLSLLLKPGEFERRTSGEEADTSGLGQDVAMFLFLMHRQRKEMLEKLADASTNCPSCGRHDFGLWSGEIRELKELRRKVGDWADARLGAMVRRMPEGSELIRCKMPDIAASDFSKWAIEVWGDGDDDQNYSGDTPEEALEKAGCGEAKEVENV